MSEPKADSAETDRQMKPEREVRPQAERETNVDAFTKASEWSGRSWSGESFGGRSR